MFKLSNGQDKLYQWDSNIKLLVDESGGKVDEVHFAARYSDNVLPVEVIREENVVYVYMPNILLQQIYDITAYAYVEDENGSYTKYERTFNVISRPKPSNYIYTETEVLNYKSLEKRIADIEKNGAGGGIAEEKDPTVPAWAKQRTKPSYTADEVGALPKNTKIPTKLSDLENDLELEVEGTVEITDGEPTKESTVMTLNPNAEEVNLYTAKEIDEVISKLSEDISNFKGSGLTEYIKIDEKVLEGSNSITPSYAGAYFTILDEFVIGNKYLVAFTGEGLEYMERCGVFSQSNTWETTVLLTVSETYRYAVVTPTEFTKRLCGVMSASAKGNLVNIDFHVFDVTGYDLEWNNSLVGALLEHGGKSFLEILSGLGNSFRRSSKWNGKKALVIGDSLTAKGVWQLKLSEMLGMEVTTHAKAGASMVQCVNGVDTFEGLKISEVYDKDLIVFFAGYNDRGKADGSVGDVYATDGSGQATIAGVLQFSINKIYEKLQGGEENGVTYPSNLTCRVMIVTPHCAGKYSYIDADGYDEYPTGSGQSMQTLAQIMEDVAHYNNLPCYNAWKNSGINRFTWSVYVSSSVADSGLTEQGSGGPYYWNADQLHLNTEVGYPHLGTCITEFVDSN